MLVYVGLGGNLGDRMGHLKRAVLDINQVWGDSLMLSSVYETEAWGMPEGTPKFFNAVGAWNTHDSMDQIWNELAAIESAAGRVREDASTTYMSRTLDCDVLAIDGRALRSHQLTVPHPRLASRRFVLEPLAEIAPDLWIAGADQSVRTILAACKDTTPVRRLDAPLA